MRVSAAASRDDRRLLRLWQGLWSLPVSRGRRPISPSRISRGANLPGALEGRAPLRCQRCQVSEGVLPPSLKLAAFGLCAPAGMRFRLPSPSELGAISSCPSGTSQRRPGQSSHDRPAAAPNPPSPEGCLMKADLLAQNLLGGGRGVCREEGKVGRPSRSRRPWRRHLGRDTPRR